MKRNLPLQFRKCFKYILLVFGIFVMTVYLYMFRLLLLGLESDPDDANPTGYSTEWNRQYHNRPILKGKRITTRNTLEQHVTKNILFEKHSPKRIPQEQQVAKPKAHQEQENMSHQQIRPKRISHIRHDMISKTQGQQGVDIYPLKESLTDANNRWNNEDDGIIDQLNYHANWSAKNEQNIPVKKILLFDGFGGWSIKPGQTTFLEQKCLVNRCDLTDARSIADSADAILFKLAWERWPERRNINQIWILFSLESPHFTQSLSDYRSVFNWTATYRRDSDIVAPYEKIVYKENKTTAKPIGNNYAFGKNKKVAWFVSRCDTPNKRLEYAMELQRYIQVDIFGQCGGLNCPRNNNNCSKILNRDYKFYLAFENSNCRDYITEKFFVTGLQHDVLPVVMGAAPEDYARAAPPHSYIHVDDYESPRDLAEYLNKLDTNDDLYNEYFNWKGSIQFIDTKFWCRVCAWLHDSTLSQRYYADIESWWRGNGVCVDDHTWRHPNKPTLSAFS